MKDPQTLVHKGYGFVSFVDKTNAENAITGMNGQWIGTRKIRTNWATRKAQPGELAYSMNGATNGSSAPVSSIFINFNHHLISFNYNFLIFA
jgi:RNA recognition motif-containing protein